MDMGNFNTTLKWKKDKILVLIFLEILEQMMKQLTFKHSENRKMLRNNQLVSQNQISLILD